MIYCFIFHQECVTHGPLKKLKGKEIHCSSEDCTLAEPGLMIQFQNCKNTLYKNTFLPVNLWKNWWHLFGHPAKFKVIREHTIK